MTLLICPVRPGDRNEELRFALRSWEANLILPGGLELLTVGHCPPWLKPNRHVVGNRYASAALSVYDNVWLASGVLKDHDEPALYMNDDFFCLDPVGEVLPVKRNEPLAAQRDRFPKDVGLWWPRSLDLTASWLESEGFPACDSYEAHRPLSASPGAMFQALSRWRDSAGWTDTDIPDAVPQWRTIYGVLTQAPAYPVQDCKLGLKTTGIGTPWVSTSDESWRRYGPPLVQRFRNPSRWEIS